MHQHPFDVSHDETALRSELKSKHWASKKKHLTRHLGYNVLPNVKCVALRTADEPLQK